VVVALLVIPAFGCAGGTAASAASSGCPIHYVQIAGKHVRVPVEPGCGRITGQVGTGDQVIIGPAGVYPEHLFAQPKVRITFTNLTPHVQRVDFEYSAVRSPRIAPGGRWSWTSDTAISLTYDTSGGGHGLLDIGALP